MRISPRWLAVPAALTAGAMAYLWIAWGLSGLSGLLLLLSIVLGVLGPVVAAIHLGDRALRSPPLRRTLLGLLAFPAAAGLLVGCFLYRSVEFDFAVAIVFLGLLVLTPCALLATAFGWNRPGNAGLRGAASSLWTLVLAGAVFCGSALPAGWACQALAVDRAKSWVEAAAADVRAVERATGRVPETLESILPRLGPAPGLLPPPGFGYVPGAGAGEFEFHVREPGGMFGDGWTYDGRSGQWTFESD